MSLLSSFFGGPSKEVSDTKQLMAQARAKKSQSSLPDVDAEIDFVMSVMADVGKEFDATLGMRIGSPVFELINNLFAHEPLTISFPDGVDSIGLAEGADYRNRLRSATRMLSNEEHYKSKWREVLIAIIGTLYKEFPDQCFVDPDIEGDFDEYSRLSPLAPVYSYVKGLPVIIHKIIATVFAQDLVNDGLFDDLREQLHINLAQASNIRHEDRFTTKKQFVMPEDKSGLDDGELIHLYLAGTPFINLLMTEVPLYIPEAVRFEHTHVLAGTGHGKTQTLQFLIAGDLEQAIKERRSVVVMDSQGDLLDTLMHSGLFAHPELRDRFIYIDPQDMERPVGLNLFDVDVSKGSIPSPVARETILNNTVELYDFFFGALLGAELTQKQGVVFRYLAVLMMVIPNANVHTLRELMEDGNKFRPYMKLLQGSARVFFETRFFDKAFNETKKQILNRLWGVLSSQSLDRMMSAPKNSVDLFSSLQEGSIVFINTAKDFLGEEGSAIFSRMFVALLGQALMRRAALPKHERTPTYIYIDEAERVVDQTLTRMLAQVRKYRGAITFAHQNLDQLDPAVRAGVMANTSIKLAGGVSAKDARALSEDFRCDTEFLLSQKKGKTETHFACFARNVTEQAVGLSVPLGFLESGDTLSRESYEALIEQSRARYGIVYVEDRLPDDVPAESPSDWFASGQPAEVVERIQEDDSPDTQPIALQVETPEITIIREPPSVPCPRSADVGGGGVKHK